MEHTPSRQFIIRASIVIIATVLFLGSQTQWFKSYLSNDKKKFNTAKTLGEAVQKDSNSNGIADWEEKLWGLDPTVESTNGISNKDIITQKKAALSLSEVNTGTNNETDRAAKQLSILTSTLGQSDDVSTETLQNKAKELSSSVKINEIKNAYSIDAIKTVDTSKKSLQAYQKSMATIIAKYNNNVADIDIIATAIETGDYSTLDQLTETAKVYKKLSEDLVKVTVPTGLAGQQLALVNSISGMSDSLQYIQQIETNSIVSFAGIGFYKQNNLKFNTATNEIRDYLLKYDIITL